MGAKIVEYFFACAVQTMRLPHVQCVGHEIYCKLSQRSMQTIIYSESGVDLMTKGNLMTCRLNVNIKNFMIIKVRQNDFNVFINCRFTRYSTILLYKADALVTFYFFMVLKPP